MTDVEKVREGVRVRLEPEEASRHVVKGREDWGS